jgi:carboxymethylenebutenolidase
VNDAITTADLTVPTPDGPMRLYTATPPGAPLGAVIVIQEAFGLNGHIEDVTRRAAEAGYAAVAPDLFHRSGPGAIAEYGKFDDVIKYFTDLGNDDAILRDVDATLAHLRAQGFADANIAIVGFCFGGRVTFLVALQRAIGAAVGFYGGGIVTGRFPQFPPLLERAAELRTPWLGLFGDEDASIPVDDVETLRATLDPLPTATGVVRYPAAGHGFHCDQRADFRAEDANNAWSRMLDWFATHAG